MYVLKINQERCKTCKLCLKSCKKSVLAVGGDVNSKGYRYVVAEHPENCIGCLSCALMCPDDAIEIFEEE